MRAKTKPSRSIKSLLRITLVVAATAPACGSGSATNNADAGRDTSGAGGGGAGGAGGDAAACTPSGVSAATVDAGALWACYQGACATELAACATDCTCNNTLLMALGCSAGGGAQTTCFMPLATAGGQPGLTVVACLLSAAGTCSPRDGAAGADAADAPAGDGAGRETSDAPGADGGRETSDAPSE